MLHSYIQKTRWAIFLSLLGPLQACESSDDEFNREMIATTPQAIRYGTPDADDSYRSVMGIAIKTREKASIYCSASTETRLECAMEGERFFDLVRWGIAAEVMNRFIEREKTTRVYYQGTSFTSGRDEYLPVSNNQYKFSGRNYVQNPGYGEF